MSHTKTLTLKVIRGDPELISPARPTPKELKHLSDIDDISAFRLYAPNIQFYRECELAAEKDPAEVIKEAISRALVYYYPLAGRLRKIGEKFLVDCTAEGVMFAEADADVGIDEFGNVLFPPFPCADELFLDLPESLYDIPLLYFQVTRLKCGGFILGVAFNYIMCDGSGFGQFMTSVSELARGFPAPSICPVWKRDLLTFDQNPPFSASDHLESNKLFTPIFKPIDGLVQSGFVFDSVAISSLRNLAAPHLPKCTTFELITGAVWHAWTLSLNLDQDANVSLRLPMNARNRFPVPNEYYGNAVVLASVNTTAGELKTNSFSHTVKLIQNAKTKSSENFKISMLNLISAGRTPPNPLDHIHRFRVSDLRWFGFNKVDYGWGEPVYGGPGTNFYTVDHSIMTFLIPIQIKDNEYGIVVPMVLHKPAMDIFTKELNHLMGNAAADGTRKS